MSIAFDEIKSDHYGKWEEESVLECDADVDDVELPFLQKYDEERVNVLHELS